MKPAGHTSSMREAEIGLEAWAATCERCLVETVDALVDCFVVGPRPCPSEVIEWTHMCHDPESLLGYLLEWVIYHRRVFARIPVVTSVEKASGWDIRLETADVSGRMDDAPECVHVQAVDLRPEFGGWRCTVTLDASTESDELSCTPAPENTPRIQHVISARLA
ncbi:MULTISPECIES: archease [Nocardia]|nr:MULTISPECIES: archease [Nocardia]MBF6278472.1 archease [Nocardia nova]MBV7705901.1 archease [Nocardia nova]